MWRSISKLSHAFTEYAARFDRRARGVPETPISFDEVLSHLRVIATSADAARAVKRFETFWWATDNDRRLPGPEDDEQWQLVWDFVDDLHLFEPNPKWREAGLFGAEEARTKVAELLRTLGDPAAT